jgi:hypothetical protein
MNEATLDEVHEFTYLRNIVTKYVGSQREIRSKTSKDSFQ